MSVRTLKKGGEQYAFKRIAIQGLQLNCDHGSRKLHFVLKFPRHFPYPLIAESGDFKTVVSSESGRNLFLRGHFGNRSASGEVRYKGRYDSFGVCRSKWQRWRLVRTR